MRLITIIHALYCVIHVVSSACLNAKYIKTDEKAFDADGKPMFNCVKSNKKLKKNLDLFLKSAVQSLQYLKSLPEASKTIVGSNVVCAS